MKANILYLPKIPAMNAPNGDIPLSIILNQINNFSYAIIENFIDVITFQDENPYARAINLYSTTHLDCFRVYSLGYDLLHRLDIELNDILIQAIDLGYYISATCDTFYLSPYITFKKDHFDHQLLLYGYNKDEKVFYGSDYFDLKVRSSSPILMDEIQKSCVNFAIEPIGKLYGKYNPHFIDFIKLDNNMIRKPNYSIMKEKIRNFINNKSLNNLDYCYFGIQFIDFIIWRMQEEKLFVPKHFNFLRYHMSLMRLRLQLIESDLCIDFKECLQLLEDCINDCKVLELTVIKALYKNKCIENIEQWTDRLYSLKERYLTILSKILYILG